jgi:hypothetical protein
MLPAATIIEGFVVMSEKSSGQPDKQSASKKRTITEGPVEEVQAKESAAAEAYRSLAGGQTLSPDEVLTLQRTVGNQAVNGIIGGATLMRQEGEQRTLSEALNFDSVFEDPGRVVDTAHPIISNIITLTRELLLAKFVEQDRGRVREVYTQVSRLYDQLRNAIRQAGQRAPHQTLWSMEEMALMRIIGEAESGPRYARLGAYTLGRERHSVRHLRSLNQRVARVLSPGGGRAATSLPGGTIERKIYVGSVPGPTFIANFYVILKITLQGSEGGRTSVGASTSEGGETSPSVSTSAETAGGGELSAEVSGGESGPQGTASVQGSGPGDSTTQAQVDTSGEATGTITVPFEGSFTGRAQINSSGEVSYRVQNRRQASLQLSGGINSVAVTAMAPELRMGPATVQCGLKVEIVPNMQLWARSTTQSAQTIEAFQTAYVASLVGMAGTTFAVVLGAATVESTIVFLAGTTTEGAPVLLNLGRAAVAAAPAAAR